MRAALIVNPSATRVTPEFVAAVCANVDIGAAVAIVGEVDQTGVTQQVCRIGRAGRGPQLSIVQN